jgi:hypothetical protein
MTTISKTQAQSILALTKDLGPSIGLSTLVPLRLYQLMEAEAARLEISRSQIVRLILAEWYKIQEQDLP